MMGAGNPVRVFQTLGCPLITRKSVSTAGRVALRSEQRIADGDLAASQHLGVDAHIGVAEGAPEDGDQRTRSECPWTWQRSNPCPPSNLTTAANYRVPSYSLHSNVVAT